MRTDAYTVSQINSYIKNMFTQDFALSDISVKGEISNLKYHPTGHIYFTMKDGDSQLSAVMFAGNRAGVKFRLENGMQVIVRGSVDVYTRGGSYQIYAKKIVSDGIGDLFLAFEQKKQELSEMGMFSDEYKQEIPRFAQKVGIVTAVSGAAVRDIIQIATRRNPYVELILYPAQVQGDGAKESIVKGIRLLDEMNLDVMIVGRGGGSIEDLWAFNEEDVARAIFNAKTPIISAVGHETDVTIADYVADLRAPTPSAAAELAVFDYAQFENRREDYARTFQFLIRKNLETDGEKIKQFERLLALKNPKNRIDSERHRAMLYEDAIRKALQSKLDERKHRLQLLSAALEGGSPLKRLEKGYGYIAAQNGKSVRSVDHVKKGEILTVYLQDGQIITKVSEVRKNASKEEGRTEN